MMRALRWVAAAIVVVIVAAADAGAGEVREIELADGSVIAGEVLSAAEGVYTIRTVSLGTIRLEEAKIRAIRSQASAASPAPAEAQAQARSLLFRMMGDQQIMSMITSLKNDPEFRKVLEDPEVMAAVISGNTAALAVNPQFMKLMESKTVRDITDKMTR